MIEEYPKWVYFKDGTAVLVESFEEHQLRPGGADHPDGPFEEPRRGPGRPPKAPVIEVEDDE